MSNVNVAYNKERELLTYKVNEGFSCFGLSKAKALAICPELDSTRCFESPMKLVEVKPHVMDALIKAHRSEKYKCINGFYVDIKANVKHVTTAIYAAKNNIPVMLEYYEGYECFSEEGIHSADGLVHTCWVGETGGAMRTLLHCESSSRTEGCSLMFVGLKRINLIS